VELGRPDSRTTRTARDTASLTPPSSAAPDGLTLKATIIFTTPKFGKEFGGYWAHPAPLPRYPLVTSTSMSRPLPFDPIARAAQLWEDRIGPSGTMAAVTGLMRVQQIIQSAVDNALKPHGLTFARYEALVLLTFARRHALPMRVMGERLQLHPTSVTNIVDRLEKDGLVKRMPHPTDRRTTLVEITDDGRSRRERATKAVTTIDFGLVGLTDRQTEQLTDLLTKVRKATGDFAE
jgi:DNA-binding MarR family transcriptional regulator